MLVFIYLVDYAFYFSVMCFFFFKQKTAYEMRISDWSSDVCSSDLQTAGKNDGRNAAKLLIGAARIGDNAAKSLLPIIVLKVRHGQAGDFIGEQFDHFILVTDMMIQKAGGYAQLPRHAAHIECLDSFRPRQRDQCRSEEHTSELQSLMRISYAVLCLNKKTN